MMKPLRREHEVISKVLRSLEERIERFWREGEDLSAGYIEDILRFSEDYVMKYHFTREESCLIPALRRAGVGEDSLKMVLSEHKSSEKMARRLKILLRLYSDRKVGVEELADSCMEFVEFLRQHIYKEDTLIFTLCEDRLSEEAEELLECLGKTDPSIEARIKEILKRITG